MLNDSARRRLTILDVVADKEVMTLAGNTDVICDIKVSTLPIQHAPLALFLFPGSLPLYAHTQHCQLAREERHASPW